MLALDTSLNVIFPRFKSGARLLCIVFTVLAAGLVVVAALRWSPAFPPAAYAPSREVRFPQARLSEQVSIRSSGLSDPRVSLTDGRDLLTSYLGPENLRQALERNEAQARSLASADFDEDGVPDLLSGYAYAGQGIVTVHRGNIDSIYPNAPEAQRRKAEGSFTAAPFLSPALAIEVQAPVDFLGAGDFDADGHWDIVLASRGGTSLHFLAGDGKGGFGPEKETALNGSVTAFTTGEINRRDGLTDIVVGIDGPDGPRVCIFEGPLGAMPAQPEIFSVSATVTAVTLGQLDEDSPMDLTVAAGNDLLIVHGRDRKLTLSDEDQAGVSAPLIDEREFLFSIRSLSIGEFTGEGSSDIALLTDQGEVFVLSQPGIAKKAKPSARTQKRPDSSRIVFTGSTAMSLLSAHVSTSTTVDDLILLDENQRKLKVVSPSTTGPKIRKGSEPYAAELSSFDVGSSPMAMIPMRLDPDALQDFVILRQGVVAPTVLQSRQRQLSRPPGDGTDFVSFSNSAAITMPGGFASPPRAANLYPSTISVSGVPGTVDKLRVRLSGVSMGSFEQDIDLLLVGPAGQKLLLMSDVDTACVISNQTLSFDDAAPSDLGGFNCVTGTYKPKDNPPADTFPAPAPSGPYQTTLASFNGTNPNGTWSLYMVDDASSFGSGQTIAGGWTLFFGPDSPSTFVVTNTNTSGAGSLAQAILDANDHLGADNITFNIPGPGPYTITGLLPSVSDPVSIDATTQPGFAGTPIIEKQGGGFVINGGTTLVRGFVINSGGGISLQQNGNNIIEGNYIGINVAGTAAVGSLGGNGITVDTANNVIGGTAAAARNVIANVTYGVQFSTFEDDPNTAADDASNNLIEGNFIGLNAAGTAIIPISHACVTSRSAPGSPSNTIGGTSAGARNVL